MRKSKICKSIIGVRMLPLHIMLGTSNSKIHYVTAAFKARCVFDQKIKGKMTFLCSLLLKRQGSKSSCLVT